MGHEHPAVGEDALHLPLEDLGRGDAIRAPCPAGPGHGQLLPAVDPSRTVTVPPPDCGARVRKRGDGRYGDITDDAKGQRYRLADVRLLGNRCRRGRDHSVATVELDVDDRVRSRRSYQPGARDDERW